MTHQHPHPRKSSPDEKERSITKMIFAILIELLMFRGAKEHGGIYIAGIVLWFFFAAFVSLVYISVDAII